MKSTSARVLASVLLAVLAWLALAGATTGSGTLKEPDKLVILSTVDVKGKTSPCG